MTEHLLLIGVVVAISFLIKAVVGFGGPLLAIPVLAPVLGIEHAVVALSLANLAANLWLFWEHRAAAAETWGLLARLVTAGAGGTVAGTWLLTRLDGRWLSLAVAVMVFAYIAVALARPHFRLSEESGLRLSWPVGMIGGIVHGATANSGPVFVTFFHGLALTRSAFVFGLTSLFFTLSSIQIGTLAVLGAFSGERLVEAAWAVVPVLAVSPIGSAIARRLDPRVFARIVLALLGVVAARLAYTVLAGL